MKSIAVAALLGAIAILFVLHQWSIIRLNKIDLTDRNNFQIKSVNTRERLPDGRIVEYPLFYIDFKYINIFGREMWQPVTKAKDGYDDVLNEYYEEVLTFKQFDQAIDTLNDIIRENKRQLQN